MPDLPCLICPEFPKYPDALSLCGHIADRHPNAARVMVMCLALHDLPRQELEECVTVLTVGALQSRPDSRG